MIVVMQPQTATSDVEQVLALLARSGLQAHVCGAEEPLAIVCPGRAGDLNGALSGLPGVLRVVDVTDPYSLVSREYRRARTVVAAGGTRVGGPGFVVVAGPCAVESPEQLAATADGVAAAGATLLRGGAFKPRTSPYSFQGLGPPGLELLEAQRRRTGLGVVTEVMEPRQVERVALAADVLQVGARSMQNYPLLREVGRARRPVLLKRAMSATIEEWLLAAEYVVHAGNPDVILCERGIRTFEPSTRFTLDLSAVPVAKQRSHLPVIVDPSHGTGVAGLVEPMSLAAAAVGADGVMVDVHPTPACALCDAPQALTIPEFERLVRRLEQVLRGLGRALAGRPVPLVAG